MAGESGGELDAAMLDIAMLDGAPGVFALETSAGAVATSDGSAVLAFIASAEAAGVSSSALDALLSFIVSQADASGVTTVSLDALLSFNATQIDASGVASISLDAWLQMLHAQGDLAQMMMQICAEDCVIRLYDDARTIKPAAESADLIENNNLAVTI